MPPRAINTSSQRGRPAPGRRLALPVPGEFNFLRTVQSHGWFDLPPFDWDADAARLTRTLSLPDAGPTLARISFDARRGKRVLKVELAAKRAMTRTDLQRTARDVAHMFRLDEDLASFYLRAGEIDRPDLRWTSQVGAGRLLRSPTVFEDLVKMVCTTNCTWALTRVMVSALVERLGHEAPGGLRLFPDAAAMAGRTERFYRDVVRAGYRGRFLRGLARRVADGEVDLESWNEMSRPTADIREEILSFDGAGRYVADNMLKLLGRYEGLGIDSWCRRKFSQMYHKNRSVSDRTLERFYAPFAHFRGLALWCDITRDWFDGDQPLVGGSGKSSDARY